MRIPPFVCLSPPQASPGATTSSFGALKRACGLVGLDPKSIGTHSLRRTGAQLLERLKIVPESAKPKMGRWKPRSKVYKKYTKLPSEESLPKAERLAYGKAMASLLEG